ncbi:hypothetical protein C4D60_Mb09t09630 [Musa balbisiana]|uniref:Uncharacterized protein n=1 Tax=Musa balbisiana TaxID=52838 RepID=A0A4S8IGI8_MUSBA|nr:hypothetical protein C4D60_Mb09t09630 [Musa balbisiana]
MAWGKHTTLFPQVSLVLLGGIIFAGTFLGYWSARKFVLSEDGCVDSGIAQFVKWTLRLIGIVSILQAPEVKQEWKSMAAKI